MSAKIVAPWRWKMAKLDLWYQCRLQQGESQTVGWIEGRGAKIGADVELPELGGMWRVIAVYNHMDGTALREKQARDRNSLPSIVGND